MFPQLPVSRFIISFNDFDLRLVTKERDVSLIYKISNFMSSVCMELLLVPFFILPSPLQRIVTQLSCSVAVTYSALGIYRLSIFYPVYVAMIVAVIVVVLLVLVLGLFFGARLIPSSSHQQTYSYPGNNVPPSHDNDVRYAGSESRVSWMRYFFGAFFQRSANEYRIEQSSFTELHQGGEMKLDGQGVAASLRTWKSRHQLEAVPEQSENASEDDGATTAEHKVDDIGSVPNHPDPSRKRKKSLTEFASSPPARKAVRQRSKLRKRRMDETDNDSYGPGASINSIDEDFITIESNHSSAEKPGNATVLSDITPLDHGILKGPGSTMYQVRDDKSTSHPMWR